MRIQNGTVEGMPVFREDFSPIELNADVVVAGGGTAGASAAIAAARRGVRVLLVEEANCLGGTSTAGGVHEWFASLDGCGDIFDQSVRRLAQMGGRYGRFFNGEYLKFVWQHMAEAAGVSMLFHASVTGAETEGGRVRTVQAAACSRKLVVNGKMFVDATGEGDLAALAGAPFFHGSLDAGYTLHMTLTALLLNNGKAADMTLPEGVDPIQSRGECPGLGFGTCTEDGRIYASSTKVMKLDPTDPLDLTRAECEARRQLMRTLPVLQNEVYPKAVLASTGSRIGIREGRRIVGDYVLTEGDVLAEDGTDFPDGVAVATSQIDFHSLTKPGHAGWRQAVVPYAIPLRAMIARDHQNLMMAGKCISGDQIAQSSYRMTPTCCMMGQAAGEAAALAVERNCADVRDTEINTLRQRLQEGGIELDPKKHTSFCVEETGRMNNRALAE